MKPGLSVVILTSPGREANLQACLSCLQRQSLQAAEIIIMDDGSSAGREIAAAFAASLVLSYHWRPNDGRLSWARNTGAEHASQPWLVFLDSDMLLNPEALSSYQRALTQFPQAAIYGYYANVRSPEDLYNSILVPSLKIHAQDQRFPFVPQRGRQQASIGQHANLLRLPQRFAWSGSFALAAEVFWSVGGFDLRFEGWGYEDMDLGHRLVNAAVPIHFLPEAWAEACPHAHSWSHERLRDKNLALLTPLAREPQASLILGQQNGLLAAWQAHYYPQHQQRILAEQAVESKSELP